MIKLKPIAENILNEAGDSVTWGDVKVLLNSLLSANKKGSSIGDAGDLAKSVGKTIAKSWVKNAIGAMTGGVYTAMLDVAEAHGEDLGKFVVNLGKNLSTAELKSPNDSKFKQMTGPFWEKLKLSPQVSSMLDDKIEAEFINTVLVPKLSDTGSDTEEIPNMDELLGAWLNNQKDLKSADIFFKGKEKDL